MDPQLKSILTSIALAAATAIAGWAASKGIIPTDDQSVLANQLVAVASGVVATGLAWYKARMVSPAAAIQQVNAQANGVKVVPASSPTPPVNAPVEVKK